MLTPDINKSNEGQTPHHWFECQRYIRPFVTSLKQAPRSLARIATLGGVDDNTMPFHVSVFGDRRHVGTGDQRACYWADFKPEKMENALVFFDPDNGFETKTMRGAKWIRHAEIEEFLSRLPNSSALVVYQHRPRRKWTDLFADLNENVSYAHTVATAYDGSLAFVAMADNEITGKRISDAIEGYAKGHRVVCYALLRHGYD